MNTRRKLPRLVLAVLCVAAVVLSACSSGSSDSSTYRFSSGTAIGSVIPVKDRVAAPKLAGKQLNGDGTITASQYKGKVIVLAFWASWCGPCRVEMPQLAGLNTELAGKGVAFVGVASRDDPDNSRAFYKSNDITFPSVVDENGELAQKLGNLPNLPFTVVLDKSGKVAAAYVVRYGAKDLERALTTLRAES